MDNLNVIIFKLFFKRGMYMTNNENKSYSKESIGSNAERRLEAKHKYEGMELKTKYGTPFIIKEYINPYNVIIEFPFSGIQHRTSTESLTTNPPSVPDPFYKHNGHHIPFTFKNPADEYLGAVFQNSYGEKYKIVEYNNYSDVTIEFLDEYRYRVTTTYTNVKNGNIRNVYKINFAGGYVGEDTTYRGKEYKWLNCLWHGVLIRTNRQDILHEKNIYNYDNSRICPEWLDYGNFARDYMNKLLALNPNFSYSIDKDLLYDKYKEKTGGYKYYSNDTTVLLPREINSGVERIMNNNLKINYSCIYNKQYQNLINWKDKVTWYRQNNGLSEIAYIALIELADNKLKEMRQKFPEYEKNRI